MCLIPVACFVACFVYYLTLVAGPSAAGELAPRIVGITSRHYQDLFIMLATSCILEAPAFIYCLILLAKMKNINAERKLLWIVFLSVFAPLASGLFWLFIVRGAPYQVPMYQDYD